jgi:hypothetical protein
LPIAVFFYQSKEVIYFFSKSSNIGISQTLYVWLVFTNQLGSIANYCPIKYITNGSSEGWYLLTNVGSLKLAVTSFRCRSGIEAMFKDCKTGGYNLENSHACYDRLKSLVLLIASAYTCAIIQGRTIKQMGIQKYVGRVQELGRAVRRHSSFWIGLYGECWVTGSEVCQDLVSE